MLPALHESMSSTDLAWLRMERPTNPMMVVGVMILASRVRLPALRSLVESRLLQFERFRELPRHDLSGTHWERDPTFSLDWHVQALSLPPRATQRHLEAAVSELASQTLDPHRPLWQFHLVERYRQGSAIVARFHHCYADGIALLRVIGSLMDESPATRPTPNNPVGDFLGQLPLIGPALTFVQDLSGGAKDIVSASVDALTHPGETAALARQISDAAAELARIALLSEDPPSPLRGKLSKHKRVAWAAPVDLDEVKTIAHVLDCTVNDVLMSSTAGAFGAYLREQGISTDDMTIRGLVPVNMRGNEATATLGNRFGLVFAHMPLGERNPVARLIATHEDMQKLKTSAQPLMSLWLLTGMGLMPEIVEEQAIEVFTKKATVVISNVPGLQYPLHLCGARVEQKLFWVPQAGSIGVGVSLLTYDGRVQFGVMADENVLAEPRRVTELFVAEFEKLLLCVVGLRDPPPRPTKRTAQRPRRAFA